MKKLLILLAFVICVINAQAEHKVKITTKDGNNIVAELVKMDGVESVTINIAGLTTTIPMSKVANIEEYTSEISTDGTNMTAEDEISKDVKFKVTDTAEYPDSIIVDVNGEKIVMKLIRGGIMNMGYEGSGSRGFHSEPVHKVKLTAFYVSKFYVNKKFYESVMEKRVDKKDADVVITEIPKKIKKFCVTLSQKTNKPFRLLTEAEWEYATFYNLKYPTLRSNGCDCLLEDNYEKYNISAFQTDPIYRNSSSKYVVRNDYGRFINKRMSSVSSDYYCFRIAIKAKDWFGK